MAPARWLLLALLLLLAGPAFAASYDPDLKWRTLETPHFRVTFHGGEEALAEEVSHMVEEVWATMTAELQWDPRRKTEVVLVDRTDSANGFASALPVNTIVIFVTTPGDDSTLSNYDEWSSSIFTHEYTHILHLDTVEGLPAQLRWVFGRIIAINQISPRWIVEGFATFQETRHTMGGRGRSSVAEMIKRMTALEGTFPPLGNMDGWQVEPPGGNLRYLFGQDFLQYISDRTGEDVLTDWTHTYGAGIPYLLPSKRVFGKTFTQLYREWRASFIARYQIEAGQIAAEGLTPFTLLSDGEDGCAGPAWSPDGLKIVWSCTDDHDGSAIWIAGPDGANPKIELEDRFAGRATWRADSKAFAFSAMHTVGRFNTYEDVYLHVLGSKGVDDLTVAKRARDPAFSPDGRDLWVVTNKAQNNQLARLTIDQRLVPLTTHTDHEVLASPRPSPDGRYLALSVWEDGARDIWIYDTEGAPYRRVTADIASDIEPAWSADGRTLFFSSDRTGVSNIYAVDLETERLWQVTNVLGGAFAPSPAPDGHAMVFESYSANGTDIAWMALDRANWRDRGLLPGPITDAGPLAAVLPAKPIVVLLPAPAPAAEEAEPGSKKKLRDREGRRFRKGRKPPQVDMPLELGPEDPLRYPGLDGLGGPLYTLGRTPGSWGRPGERPVDASGSLEDDVDDVESDTSEALDYPFTYPVSRYTPSGLFPPRYLSPSIYQTTFGFMGVLSTSGVDVLRRYLYSGYLSYRTDSRFVGWGFSAALNQFLPVYSVGAYAYTVPYGDVYRVTSEPPDGGTWIPSVESTNERYWDRRIRSYAQASYELSSRRSIFARWSGTLRTPLEELPSEVYTYLLPDRGFLSTIGGGWRYAYGKYYPYSISPEDARIVSLVGQISSPYIGSYRLNDQNLPEGFSQVQFTGEWREYRTLPWLYNHVLAAKLAVGASFGDTQAYGSYRLGGDFGETPYYTLPDEWRALRGFPSATVYGDWFYLGSAEYRLPLVWIDRGLGMIPAYARNISAAAFVDAGYAFESAESLADPALLANTRVGAGAELRGEALLGWGLYVTGRVGYAFAVVGQDGYPIGDLGGLYAWLGTSF